MERYEKNIVSHVSAFARRHQDDDVFTRHVSDAVPKRGWDVYGPRGSETLQLHPMRAHDGGMNGVCINFPRVVPSLNNLESGAGDIDSKLVNLKGL